MRFNHKRGMVLGVMTLIFLLASPITHAHEDNADLLAKLEFLQQQIDEMKNQLEQTQTQAVETDAKVEAVAEIMESGTPLVAEKRKNL